MKLGIISFSLKELRSEVLAQTRRKCFPLPNSHFRGDFLITGRLYASGSRRLALWINFLGPQPKEIIKLLPWLRILFV